MVDALGKMYFELGVEKPQPNAFADLLKSMFTPQVQSEQVPKAEPMVVADLDMD